jgi:hypothetical protein
MHIIAQSNKTFTFDFSIHFFNSQYILITCKSDLIFYEALLIVCNTFLWLSLKMALYEESTHVAVINDKGKAIPLQAWTGPMGSTRLRLPDFKTVGT